MHRDLHRLADERFDLCILGGGINGLATARDAALRGLRVALIEQGDFGAETSAGSLKILHGGLRYLQHLDFPRMCESIRERNALMRLAPHLVDPLGFLVPTSPGLLRGRAAMSAALAVNDLVGHARNRGLRDPALHLPAGRMLSVAELHARAPGLPLQDVTGAALFYDAQMRNSDRYTLHFALSAADAGAALANRLRGESFVLRDNRVEALRARDLESGETLEIRADLFAAMTGPWRDLLPELLPGRALSSREVVKNSGLQLLTLRGICNTDGLAVPGGEADPDAKLSRGARHYFSTPWRGAMLWGTPDRIYRGAPEDWRITEEEIQRFLNELNQAMPGLELRREEVRCAFGGLRLMNPERPGGSTPVARRYAISDHRADLGLVNLISMDGIKYTACRVMAEKAVDLALQKLGRDPIPVSSVDRPLRGGDFETRVQLEADWRKRLPAGGSDATVALLAESYGADFSSWDRTSSRALLPDGFTPEVLVEIAVEQEMALHLEDVVLRRLPLGCLGAPAAAVTERVAELMAAKLGWDATRKQDEIRRLTARYSYD